MSYLLTVYLIAVVCGVWLGAVLTAIPAYRKGHADGAAIAREHRRDVYDTDIRHVEGEANERP